MSAFGKELVRSVALKPGRFLALLAIVALGAGFYAGLRSTAPDMRLALDDYLDGAHAYDVRVVSTMGLEQADLDALAALDGIDQVMGARQADVLADIGDASYTTRVHSLPAGLAERGADAAGEGGSGAYLNRLELTEGRWPVRAGECIVSADRVLSQGIGLGQTVVFTQGTSALSDTFSTLQFTVVGKAHMPYYVSSAAIDASSLGSGVVEQVLYVAPESFAADMPFTDAYLTAAGAGELRCTSSAYDELVAGAKAEVESIAEARCQARLDSLTDALYDEAGTYEGMLALLEYRLSRTKAEVDDPEPPTWLVMGRDKNAGMASFTSDADRVERIASIFPLIFFLVAALVALTTMTRMVDEERQIIGTHKALGYTRGRITWKYAAYVLAAGVVGSALGIAVLTQVLPGVIMNAYAIMYYVPSRATPIDGPIALASAGLAVGVALLATWAACAATLREGPAALMLPRTPKAGKRILLERVTPVWGRLSFSWKVTWRNLLRYKKRFVMTATGVAGCTALLLTGLGLHDAINDIIDIQYGEIIRHNAVIMLEDGLADSERDRVERELAATGALEASTKAHVATMLASGPRASDKRIDVVVVQDPAAFAQMKVLRTRQGREPLVIGGTSALLNEKMAQELGVGEGASVRVSAQDELGNATQETWAFPVGALFENYIYNYLYMTQEAFEAATGAPAEMNAIYANVSADPKLRGALDELARKDGAIRTLSYNDEVIDTYRTMLRSVDLIVVVLVVSAAALAFIVLYNLTNINIEERVREIATLKVLGFTPGETRAYIFREIALLALVGALVGLVLGVFLEGFVVTTAEVDQVMFGRAIHAPSFVAAFALTLAFCAASMLLMFPKLSRISMVESLKSNE